MSRFTILLLVSLFTIYTSNGIGLSKFFNNLLEGANGYFEDNEKGYNDNYEDLRLPSSNYQNGFSNTANLTSNFMFNNKKTKKKKQYSTQLTNIKLRDKFAFLNDSYYKLTSDRVSRGAFFSYRVLTHITLSPQANLVAFSRINRGNQEIVIKSIINRNSKKIISIKGDILSLKFLDESCIVYTLKQENRDAHLSLIELSHENAVLSKRKVKISSISIDNEKNVKSIRILKCKSQKILGNKYEQKKIAVEIFNGTSYNTYIIKLGTSSEIKLIHTSTKKDSVLFDVNINPVAFFDNFKNLNYFVYNESSLNGNLDPNNYSDKIEDRTLEKYISAGKYFIYKLKINKKAISLIKIDREKWKKIKIVNAKFDSNVTKYQVKPRIDNCNICVNPAGDPIFINYLGEKGTNLNFSNNQKIRDSIAFLDNTCGNNWHRVESSADGNIWLLCIRHFNRSNEYCVFDIRSKVIKRIKSSHPGLKNIRLNSNTYVRQVDIGNNKIIPVTITLSKIKENAPSVLLLQMNNSNYRNGFMSFSQFLANRGYNVVSINYHNYTDFKKIKKDKKSEQLLFQTIEIIANDIITLIKELNEDKTEEAKSIFVIGEGIGGAVAQRLYSLNQKIFSNIVNIACPILALDKDNWPSFSEKKKTQSNLEFLSSELEDDEEYNTKINKKSSYQTLIINSAELLQQSDQHFLEEHEVNNFAYYVYKNEISNYAKAAMIENFLAKICKNKAEPIDQTAAQELDQVSGDFQLFNARTTAYSKNYKKQNNSIDIDYN